MIDLHTHTFFSDGVLIPSELIQRARKKGYRAIAITDHADSSNFDHIIPRLKRACVDAQNAHGDIICMWGVELTHVHPKLVEKLTKECRKAGAEIVVFHGETSVEPVEPGSNTAAILAGVDILAHPGFITFEDAVLAAKRNVLLEITARAGHNNTNNHVFEMAKKAGARMCFDTDAHTPENLVTKEKRAEILAAAGMSAADINEAIANSEELVRRKRKKAAL